MDVDEQQSVAASCGETVLEYREDVDMLTVDEDSSSGAMDIEYRPDMAPGWVTSVAHSGASNLSSKLRGKHHENRLEDIAQSRRKPPSQRLAKGSTVTHRWSPQPSTVLAAPNAPSAAIERAPDSPTPLPRLRSRHHENRVQDLKDEQRLSPPRLRFAKGCWSRSVRWSPGSLVEKTSDAAHEQDSSQATRTKGASKPKPKSKPRKKSKKRVLSTPVLQLAASIPLGGFDFDLIPEPRTPSGIKRERAMSDEGDFEYRERQEEGRGLWKLSFEHDCDTHHEGVGHWKLSGHNSNTHHTTSEDRGHWKLSGHNSATRRITTVTTEPVDTRTMSIDSTIIAASDDEDGDEVVDQALLDRNVSTARGEKRKRRDADDGTVEYRDRWAMFWGRLAKALQEDDTNLERTHEVADNAKALSIENDAAAAIASEQHADQHSAQPERSSQAIETNVAVAHEAESSETALPSRNKVFYYDLAYAGQMLSCLLYTSLPTMISEIKHAKGSKGSKAAAYKAAQQWLDKTGISDSSHEFMEKIWSDFVPMDSDEDSEADYADDETELGPCEVGQVLDQVFEEKIRPALAPRPELEELSQSLTSAQQRALRTRLKDARKVYMDKHEGIEAEPYRT